MPSADDEICRATLECISAELGALLRKNARDWVELQIEVQAALVGAFEPDKPVERAVTLHAV